MTAHKNNKYAQKGDEPMTAFLHCRITKSLKARSVKSLHDKEKLCEFVMLAIEAEIAKRESVIKQKEEK